MITLNEWYKEVNYYLPKGEVCKTFSVYPAAYKDYYELWVETESNKRFRALLNGQTMCSEMTEFQIPQNIAMQGVHK